MYFYGLRLRRGWGIKADPEAAAGWYKKAANAGDLRAKAALAYMLSAEDSGIAQDVVTAKQLYRQVIEADGPDKDLTGTSWHNLGVANENAGDYLTARSAYQQAIQLGFAQATESLANLDNRLRERAAEEERQSAIARRQAAENARQLAQSTLPGAPTSTELLRLLASSYVRNFSGQLTSTPGEVAFASPFGGIQHYERRTLSNVNCSKLAAGAYRCSFDSIRTTVGASDSFLGKLTEIGAGFFGPTKVSRIFTFTKGKSGEWQSAELDQSNRTAALAQARQASSSGALLPSGSSVGCKMVGGVQGVYSGGMATGITWGQSLQC